MSESETGDSGRCPGCGSSNIMVPRYSPFKSCWLCGDCHSYFADEGRVNEGDEIRADGGVQGSSHRAFQNVVGVGIVVGFIGFVASIGMSAYDFLPIFLIGTIFLIYAWTWGERNLHTDNDRGGGPA